MDDWARMFAGGRAEDLEKQIKEQKDKEEAD